jgi:twitching motility protein PilI
MAQRESLKEYQDDILQKMELARLASAVDTTLFFGFVAHGIHFLIDGRFVVETTNPSVTQPMPVAKLWAVGVANIKGTVHSVTDLSLLLGGKAIKRGKFLVLNGDVIPGAALLVDSLSNLYEKEALGPPLEKKSFENQPAWVVACHQIGAQNYYLIDGAALASDPRFSNLQSGDNT